jgi:hypothetical protein
MYIYKVLQRVSVLGESPSDDLSYIRNIHINTYTYIYVNMYVHINIYLYIHMYVLFRYSNGCQYWAGASAMTLVIYDTISFTQLMAFQGEINILYLYLNTYIFMCICI